MDALVQQRVGESGVIDLVVSPAPEAVVVDEHVLAELTLVLECDVCCFYY